MRECAKKIGYKGLRAIIVAAVSACLFAFALMGCATPAEISFIVPSLSMSVGESRELTYYMHFSPVTASDRSVVLTADGDCVSIDGTVIKAVKPGDAKITAAAAGGSAQLFVSVSYHPASNLRLSHSGETVQTIEDGDEPGTVTFNAVHDDNVDPDIAVRWTVNGAAAGSGDSFELAPDGYGEFRVTAELQSLSCTEVVRIYRTAVLKGCYDGELEQFREFSPVRFYAQVAADPRDPRADYLWTVNGEEMSREREFIFTPLMQGDYEVGLKINGVVCEFDGKSGVTVRASGGRAPRARVEFDDRDGVFVVWDDGAVARSVTVSAGGSRTVYNSFDIRYSHLFGAGCFDASGIIQTTSAEPVTYTVSVAGDEQGESVEFAQYPTAASAYINIKLLCKNSFITSAADAADWITELYLCGERIAKGYLSRESREPEACARILEAARARADMLGLNAAISASDGYIRADIAAYNNTPADDAKGDANRRMTELPHLKQYGEAGGRGDKFVFAIDRGKKTVKVTNSEQLLAAVMNGYAPEFTYDSAVSAQYKIARNALLSIIGADYTDRQKVHAIHDWLQLCTHRVSDAAPGSSADFLEGTFDRSFGYGVSCRGMAKAFALMCCIEGIECDIQAQPGEAEYYFWNKVKVDGLWYNVDAFGGELTADGTVNEIASHGRLFISDSAAKKLGLEPSGHAAYDDSGFVFTEKELYGGAFFDKYFASADVDNKPAIRAAVFGEFSRMSGTSFAVYTPKGITMNNVDFLGVEIATADGMDAAARTKLINGLISAAEQYFDEVYGVELDKQTVNILSADGIIQLSVAKPPQKS